MEHTYNASAFDIANFSINMASNNCNIGHLIKLKVGGVELKQDFAFPDPMSPKSLVKMCGMVTHFYWNGEPGGQVIIEGRVPYTCKGMLQGAIAANDKTAECEFEINFYSPEGEKAYCLAFTTKGQTLSKVLRKECVIDNNKATDYTHIPNHSFKLVLDPSDTKAQEMHMDFGNKNVHVFPYGGQVAAG